MKKICCLLLLVMLALVAGHVCTAKDTAKKNVDVRVETQVSGQVITVTPDGNVTVEEFGDGGVSGTKNKKKKERGNPEDKKREARVFSLSKTFTIGPDETRDATTLAENMSEALEKARKELPKEVQDQLVKSAIKKMSKAFTVGPDETFDATTLAENISQALQELMNELPKETQHQLMDSAMKRAEIKRMQDQLIDSSKHLSKDVRGQMVAGHEGEQANEIHKKLDAILHRLDTLEKQVRELKEHHK